MDGLLNQTCKIYKTPSNPDKYGKITWGTFDVVGCRFVKTSKHYKNSQGEDVNISCKFQVAGDSTFAEIGTKIEYKNNFYKVIDYKEWVDGDGEVFGWLYYCDNYPTA